MTTTSKEYAEALFELSVSENQTTETARGLRLVEETLREVPEYRAMLASPAISRDVRLQSLEDAFRDRVPAVLMGVLRMMVSRGHVNGLEEMIRHYGELARDFRGESVARVSSAVELTEEEKAALQESLEKRFGRRVELRCEVVPALLGGVRVEIDGKVIDGSLRNKLDQIKEVMHE